MKNHIIKKKITSIKEIIYLDSLIELINRKMPKQYEIPKLNREKFRNNFIFEGIKKIILQTGGIKKRKRIRYKKICLKY